MTTRLPLRALCLSLLLAGLPALAGAPPAVTDTLTSLRTLQVEGVVVIDTAGKVTDYQVESALDEALRATVDKAVRSWTFQPVRVDGQPRRAQARMRITLAATPVAEGFQVRVDNVIFPGDEDKPAQRKRRDPAHVPTAIEAAKLLPPQYPMGLMKAGVAGVVLVAIHVGEDGKAQDVAAVQSMLLDVRGSDKTLQRATGMLEQSALAAARRWTFRLPPDYASYPPEKRVITTTVEYLFDLKDRYSAAGVWRTVVRTPKREIEWMPRKPGTQSVGVADVSQGEFVPVASAMQLASDVVGTVL